MKIELNIVGKDWQTNRKGIYFRGYIVNKNSGEVLKDIDDVKQYFFNDYYEFVEGEYTYIEEQNGLVCIKTDATKLYPLWYRVFADRIVIADDIYSLITEDTKIDKTQRKIFEQNGALLGDGTLYNEIRRVERIMVFYENPVENYTNLVKIDHPDSSFFIETSTDETIEKDFCKAIDRAFDVMFSSLSVEQQIVIPLSGGYDSRLIACQVKKRGWKNVLAYTMGKDIEGEQNIAREVAHKLGFKFVQIDFEKVVPQGEVDSVSSDLKKCIDFVGQGQNFEWLADYYAIKYLRSMELLEDNAVFVPGFCGDVNGGSYHRKLMVSQVTRDLGAEFDMIDKLIALRFERGNPYNLLIHNRLCSYLSLCGSNMQFFMEQYLPNKILNACRVPFYFGYEVRLPFFNRYFLEFCYKLPVKYLKKRIVYNEVLMKYYFEPYDVCFKKKETSKSAYVKQYLKSYVKAFLPRCLCVRNKKYVDTVQEVYLAAGMRKELVGKGLMKDMDDYLSANEVMSKYLLTRIKERIAKEG